MKKDLAFIIGLVILFAILIFATPFLDNKTSSYLWIILFMIIAIIILIWIISSIAKIPKEEMIVRFKTQAGIIQILDIIFVIVFIYELVTIHALKISAIILFIIILIQFSEWFFKKEEN